MTSFAELGVPAPVVAALAAMDRTEAFPIQVATLPDSLKGRDVLGRGKTGSGKTIAFAVPLAARLGEASGASRPARGRKARGLVLAPTRELATQIDNTLAPLAQAMGLTTTVIFGGVSQKRQEDALRAGVDIIVATPGRLDDLMKQGVLSLDAIQITVLDEADHMADLGFLPVVTRILDKTPKVGQRMLFSATLDNGVDRLVKRYLRDEILHSVDEATSHVSAMTHHVFSVESGAGKDALVHALARGAGRRILFMRTKHQAKKLAKRLTEGGIPAVDLHGNLSQNARDRNLAAFHEGAVRVLVATDVAARGVHIDDVELVVHVDPPVEHKAYLHRSGRTARAGSAGDVVTIALPEQHRDLRDLLRKAAIRVEFEQVTDASPQVVSLVGSPVDLVPYVKPELPARGASQGGTSTGANAQRKRARRGGGAGGASNGSGQQGERQGGSRRGGQAQGGQQPGASSQGGQPRGAGQGRRRGQGGAGQGSSDQPRGQRGAGQGAPGQSRGQRGGQASSAGRGQASSRGASGQASARRSDGAPRPTYSTSTPSASPRTPRRASRP
ncbi:DEAD/DEAH box helicase [Gryllotalpicola protaetiae]|uniref:DEAD/DEAH box helicase n=1 Tax=Gryllotalpicola protaetiae TaxID=2419771 RepID=A0A387BN81_9MICO|nr:DEAD/DEAH box helicase [Gryllotalpicola protaetiae]AYG05283.1 DEAD/DEAH box helicase [Gryllotalpicola protaetiae]